MKKANTNYLPICNDIHNYRIDIAYKSQPGKGLTGATICMHVSFGPVQISQTTGSMISHLHPDLRTHWMTGTAVPCTSVFRQVWIDSGLPYLGPSPSGTYDDAS